MANDGVNDPVNAGRRKFLTATTAVVGAVGAAECLGDDVIDGERHVWRATAAVAARVIVAAKYLKSGTLRNSHFDSYQSSWSGSGYQPEPLSVVPPLYPFRRHSAD